MRRFSRLKESPTVVGVVSFSVHPVGKVLVHTNQGGADEEKEEESVNP